MKELSGLLLCFSFALFGCDNPDNRTSATNQTSSSVPKHETGKLNDYLKKYEEPSQTFNVSSSKPTQVKGKKGTIILVTPSDLETIDGKAIGKNIEIELKELINQQQLLRTNTQTVSNGQLLVSGGAYYLNMTSNGQQLKLKDDKSLSVAFPKLTDKEMALFYGQRDSLGQINWEKATETFTAKKEKEQPQADLTKKTVKKKSGIDAIFDYIESGDTTTTKEEREQYAKRQRNYKVEQKLYEAVNLQSFGWINCDRFLEVEDKTELLVKVNPADNILSANVYLVFKDINSVIQQYYYNGTAKNSSVKFEGLPVGYKTRLIAYTVKDEKAYAFASDVTIGKNQKVEIAFTPVTDQEFKSLLSR
jgi:hypothetical protein